MKAKNSMRFVAPVAGVLLLAATSSGLEVPVQHDAEVRQAQTTYNYGAFTSMGVSNVSSQNKHAYIRFEPSDYLPPNSTSADVKYAMLYLYVSSVSTAGNVNIYSVTSTWGEGKASGAPSSGNISWGSQPSSSTTIVDTISLTSTDEGEYLAVDLTPLVKAWIDTPSSNHGLVFKAGTGGVVMSFDTKDSTSTSHAPFLSVVTAEAGTKWLSGTSAPASNVGVNGDFYLNTGTSQYYIKTSGTWGSPTSLQGISGSKWVSGNGAPNSGIGVNGDYYLDLLTSVYYGPKASGVWPGTGTSIKGATGAVGPQGPATVRISAGGDLSMGIFDEGQQP